MKNTNTKKLYLEKMREISTFAVVFLHIVMTLNNNYSVSEIGTINYTVFSDCYMLVKWAVPCFIMITGSLLLNPQKEISLKKIVNYIARMLIVLFTFGTVYAFIEFFFNERTVSILVLLKSILNTACGNTWSHMWYIYVLIALYILTIPIKCFINTQSYKNLNLFIIVLIIGNFVIPTVNAIFDVSLENYMMLNEYATFYILGYSLSIIPISKLRKYFWGSILGFIISTGVMIITESISIISTNQELLFNHHSGELMVLIQAISVFSIVRSIYEDKEKNLNKVTKSICWCSFGIYLIHPFWINLIYKYLKVTPLSFSFIGLGIISLFIFVFLLSLSLTYLLKKIPIINKII